MPIYEYRCSSCSAEYDRREGFDAPPTHACERCGNEARRVLRAPAVLFKGSGFYATDSRSSSGAADGGSSSDKGDSTKSNGGGETASTEKASSGGDHGHSHGPDGHTH